jgi:hypothetical protein
LETNGSAAIHRPTTSLASRVDRASTAARSWSIGDTVGSAGLRGIEVTERSSRTQSAGSLPASRCRSPSQVAVMSPLAIA